MVTIGDHWLSFSITPVQGFIESARTVRDLAVGSHLICYQVGEAIRAGEVAGGTILFPRIDPGNPYQAVPNQFVMSFISQEEACTGMTQTRRAAQKAWQYLARDVRRLFTSWGPNWDTGWQEQIEDFWDIRTILLSAADCDQATYERLFPGRPQADDPLRRQWDLLAAAMAASKQVRHFPPHHFSGSLGIGRSKCTLLGDQEQMGPGTGEKDLRKFWEARVGFALAGGRISTRDRLCAVSLVKRFAPAVSASGPFASWRKDVRDTADVATAVWQAELGKYPETSSAWQRFEGTVKSLNTALNGLRKKISNAAPGGAEGQGRAGQTAARCLLAEDLKAELQEEMTGLGWETIDPVLADLATARRNVIQTARKANLGSPPRYLAVLALDGDQMGKRLSGEYCAAGEHSAAFYEHLSAKLLQYAQDTPDLVEQYGGLHIYAGGDDVLALLPLSHALDCLRELQRQFERLHLPGARKNATVSGVVTAFHYKHDLRDALRQTRAAEEQAKTLGRNACALRIVKRSGGDLDAVIDWRQILVLQQLQKCFLAGASDRWVGRLAQSLPAIGDYTDEAQLELLLAHSLGRTDGGDETTRRMLRKVVKVLWRTTGLFLNRRHSKLRDNLRPADRLPYPTRARRQGFCRLVTGRFLDLVAIAEFLSRGRE